MQDSTSQEISSRFAALPRRSGGVRAVKLALCAALVAAAAPAQPSADWKIDTFAGSDEVVDGASGTQARLNHPSGVAVDGAGNLYIADTYNHRIRKVDRSGREVTTTIAGSGERRDGGDGGPATAAQLRGPYGAVVDGAGNVYIADWGNERIRKVDSSGVISTIAGSGEEGFGGNGDAGPASQPLWRSAGRRRQPLHRR